MAYKSLKFVYSEQVLGTPVPALPRQQVTIPQQEEQSPVVAWPPQSLAVPFVETEKGRKQGEGNGERRVAALFIPKIMGETDKAYFNRLGKYTSGQSEDFDVKLPDDVKGIENTVGEMYEVKEIKPKRDVRIAKTGMEAEGKIATAVVNLMKYLVNYYSTLDKEGQQNIDAFLIQKIKAKGLEINDDWTLKKYCDNVRHFPKNMGKQFFHAERLTKSLRGDRKHIMLLSLDELESYLDEFCIRNQEGSITATPDENKRLNDNVEKLFKLLSDLYLPSGSGEDTSKQSKELEAKAEEIDRELTAFKCELSPGECRNNDWFCAAWDKIKSAGFISNIKNMLSGEDSLVETLLPGKVRGLFIVTEEGYEYISRNNLKNYIYISSLAGQGVKIARLQDKAVVDNRSEEEEDETV